jgi:Xaa-Pro aminopeptidase
MHWVEVSRALSARGTRPSDETLGMLEAYHEYMDAARPSMRAGATCHDVHRSVARGFLDRGFRLGHVTGHSIGMTMIESPRVGEGIDVELEAGMVFSMHPHAVSEDGLSCLYMQDTWLVGEAGGEPLAGLPMEIRMV